jgi:hypothetical protein
MFSISGFITPDLFQAAVTSASPPVIFIAGGVFFIVILVIALLPFDGRAIPAMMRIERMNFIFYSLSYYYEIYKNQ